jgi:hypothetical protein
MFPPFHLLGGFAGVAPTSGVPQLGPVGVAEAGIASADAEEPSRLRESKKLDVNYLLTGKLQKMVALCRRREQSKPVLASAAAT